MLSNLDVNKTCPWFQLQIEGNCKKVVCCHQPTDMSRVNPSYRAGTKMKNQQLSVCSHSARGLWQHYSVAIYFTNDQCHFPISRYCRWWFCYCMMKAEDWNWWQIKRPIPIEMSDFIALDEIEPVFLTTFLSTCHWTPIELVQVHTAVSQQSKD